MGWEEDVYMYVHTKHRLHVVNEEIWKTWREGIMEISREKLIRKGIRGDYCSRNFFEIPIYSSWGTCTPSFGSFQKHLCAFILQGALT